MAEDAPNSAIPELEKKNQTVLFKTDDGETIKVIATGSLGTIPTKWPQDEHREFHPTALEVENLLFVLQKNQLSKKESYIMSYFNREDERKKTMATAILENENIDKQLVDFAQKQLMASGRLPPETFVRTVKFKPLKNGYDEEEKKCCVIL